MTAPLTETELADLEAKCEAATPGEMGHSQGNGRVLGDEPADWIHTGSYAALVDELETEDVKALVACYNATPRLIADLRDAREREVRLREALAKIELQAAMWPVAAQIGIIAAKALIADTKAGLATPHPAPPQGPEPGGTSTDAGGGGICNACGCFIPDAGAEDTAWCLPCSATPDAGGTGQGGGTL